MPRLLFPSFLLTLLACEAEPPVVSTTAVQRGFHTVPRATPLPGSTLGERGEAARLLLAPGDRYVQARLQPLPNGAGLVVWRGTVDGLPVLDGALKALIDRQGRLLAWSAEAGAGLDLRGGAVILDAADAIAVVTGARPGSSAQEGAWQRFSDGTRARLVAAPAGATLRRAWEIEHTDTEGLWRDVVDAETAARLQTLSLTQTHSYRVWADDSGDLRPQDSPWGDATPHPTGAPDGTVPAFVDPELIDLDGFNLHADPWLDTAAETTEGNNVIAYADRARPDGYGSGDIAGEISSADSFDWTYDVEAGPMETTTQALGSITQAFYVTNWLHDWFYDSGFDEAAGNAQTSNYGRGGEEGDAMLVEVQDDANNPNTRNNANMSTPSDGAAPTMQMYLWTGSSLDVGGSWTADVGTATFGDTYFQLTAAVTEAGSDTTACTSVDGAVTGQIVLIDRGTCTFSAKAAAAQAAGAIGVLLVNTDDSTMTLTGTDATVTIPVLSISSSDGAAIRTELSAGPIEVTMTRLDIDGGLDNLIVAHEWGHYLYGRLLSGCGSTQCSASNEGNSDFVSLLMALREGDDPDGAYATGSYGSYAIYDNAAYYGVRRVPYSRDRAKNALTFKNISAGQALPSTHPVQDNGNSNTESHNGGEVWSTVVFDAYLALQEQGSSTGKSFADVQRRMTDILVAGLGLAPTDPTFLELRDALLTAAAAIDPEDARVLAEAFAGRGMGACAVGPDTSSTSLTGIVEDFDTHAVVSLSGLTLDDVDGSCDADGDLDAGELGAITVDVANAGPGTLSGAMLTVSSTIAGVTYPDGASVAVPDLAGFTSTVIAVPVQLDASATIAGGTFTVVVTGEGLCETDETSSIWAWTEADVQSSVATSDTFLADDGSWTLDGDDAEVTWARVDDHAGATTWVGLDLSGIRDTRLISPAMEVGTESFTLALSHRYSFETSGGVNWDGGVLELSVDGGDWQDVNTWVDPGYTATITDTSDNPLGLQEAFGGDSPGWPAFTALSLDFGTALAGHSVRLALRIGTDQAAGDDGWELASLTTTGLTNSPFPVLVADTSTPETRYADVDGDGYGDPATSLATCAETAYVADATDCDDARNNAFPGAPEHCDGLDEDCDGIADNDAVDPTTWYVDEDADGYGVAEVRACEQPEGTAPDGGDCDDTTMDSFPDAIEFCDGIDQDCNGVIDNDAMEALEWYLDEDGDGFGTTTAWVCPGTPGYVERGEDCDDTAATTNPGERETCDGVDQDCDGLIDIGAIDAGIFFADTDGDGFGEDGVWIMNCTAPDGYLADAGDCDDTDAAVFPGAPEVCNDVDDDCEGSVDVGATDAPTWHADADNDGATSATVTTAACDAPEGYKAGTDPADCDDADPARYPGATDVEDDGIDQDCDGADAVGDTGDTGDTGDSGDSGDTGDTGDSDSGTVDSGDSDSGSGDSGDGGDSGDTGSTEVPADTAGEKGTDAGCGCESTASPTWLALALAVPLLRRRR